MISRPLLANVFKTSQNLKAELDILRGIYHCSPESMITMFSTTFHSSPHLYDGLDVKGFSHLGVTKQVDTFILCQHKHMTSREETSLAFMYAV